jgi:hypothetical protein
MKANDIVYLFVISTHAALETIPKLGRRKILVNGKPCGKYANVFYYHCKLNSLL